MDLIQALITGFPFHPCSQRAEDTFMRNLKEQSLHIQSTAKAQRELFVSQLSNTPSSRRLPEHRPEAVRELSSERIADRHRKQTWSPVLTVETLEFSENTARREGIRADAQLRRLFRD